MLKNISSFLIICFLLFSSSLFSQSKEVKSLFDFTSYEKAFKASEKKGLPLFILVVDEKRDPWQISLFKKSYIQKILKEGFVSLIVSPYGEIASQLPIKRLPATFIISPQGEALLSYQGLLWEEEFYKRILPLSGNTKKYTSQQPEEDISQKIEPPKVDIVANKETQVVFEKYHEPLNIPHLDKFSFKEGSFFLHKDETWSLYYKGVSKDLNASSLKVSKFILLEDKGLKVTYAIPIEDHEMSYIMKEEDEIWEPFFMIDQK